MTRRRLPTLAVILAAALLLLAVGGETAAQQSLLPGAAPAGEAVEPAAVPDPAMLQPGWWQSIIEDEKAVGARIDQLLALAADRVGQLPEADRPEADETLARVRSNFGGYLRLRQRSAEELPRATTFRDDYGLDTILELDRSLRSARIRLGGDLAELKSRENSVNVLSRQVENRFATYLDTPVRTVERLQLGLQVMAIRAAFLLEQQQVRLLSATLDALRARVAQLEEEVAVARQRLDFGTVSAESLERSASEAAKTLDTERRRLRQAEAELIDVVAASDADSLAVANARQKVILRSVQTAVAELTLASVRAEVDLLTLQGETDDDALAAIKARGDQRAELVDRIRNRLDGWADSGEQGLSESAAAVAGDSVRDSLERRARLAADILTELQTLRRSIGDVDLLQDLATHALRERQGRLRSTLSQFGDRVAHGWEMLKRVASAGLFSIGDRPITLAGIFRVLVILFVAFWLSRLLRHALDRMGASQRTSMSQSSLYSLGRLLHYVIIIAGIIIGLSSIGLDFTNLALLASALGVGIGFGLQSVVSNFVSGLILLFERSLNVGDFVELDSGVTGVIREINVRSTLLNTNDNVDILVPNSEFVSGKLINWTLREAVKRVHIPFGVAYGTDKDLTRQAALEAADRVPLTLKGPGREPQVWLVNFGDSSLDYELVLWLGADAVRRPAAVQAAYLWEIETSLAKHGIEIPFPQRDLHLRSGMEALVRPSSEG